MFLERRARADRFGDMLLNSVLQPFLPSELDKIKFILKTNGYPEQVMKSLSAKKLKQFQALPKFGSERCPVYLRLP